VLGAVVVMALLRGALAASVDLSDDEAYYRLWALAPALSYLDHPPMVAWLIAAGRYILGDTPFGVRLAAVLTSLLGPLLLWRTVWLLFGAEVARRAVLFALAMPLLTVGGIIITPDMPSVLFWGLTGWALAELYASRNANWWLAVGLFAGLGLLSKYTNLFVGAGILIWLVGLRENWRWFSCWQLWAGGAASALLTLPVVLWNREHDWASFGKQFGRVVRDEAFAPTYLLEMTGSFFGLASPLIAALALAGLGSAVAAAVRRRDQASALLAASVLPLLGYFLLHALHARVQPNWLAPLYPSLAAAAAIAASTAWPRPGSNVMPRVAAAALSLGLLLSGLVCAHAVRPLLLSGKDPTNQLRGWRPFAKEIEHLRLAHGACSVATSHYTITAQLAFHLPATVPVLPLNEPLRYAHLPAIDAARLPCPSLYVELVRRPLPAGLGARFASVMPLGTLARRDQGRPMADYKILLLAEPLLPVAAPGR
jgi:hypothetical protein